MKAFLIGFGMVLLVLPVFLFAQEQDYTVNSDGANNNTNSAVPEGMEMVKLGGLNWVVPKGAKIERHGSQLTVEDTAQYMSRRFEGMDMRLKQVEDTAQDMRSKDEEMDMRLKKEEDASQGMSSKVEDMDTRLKQMEQKLEGLDKKK